jgi:hypothetical protein
MKQFGLLALQAVLSHWGMDADETDLKPKQRAISHLMRWNSPQRMAIKRHTEFPESRSFSAGCSGPVDINQ